MASTSMSSLPQIHNVGAHGRHGTLGAGRSTLGTTRHRRVRSELPKTALPHLPRSQKMNPSLRVDQIKGAHTAALSPAGVKHTLSSYEVASYMKCHGKKADGFDPKLAKTAHQEKTEVRAVVREEREAQHDTVDEREPLLKRVTAFPSPTVVKGAEQTDRVGQEAIKNADKKESGQWKSLDFLYAAGDFSSLPRMVYSLADTILNRPDPPGVAGLGLTSGMSAVTGGINVCKGYEEYQKSTKINDFWGRISGLINGVRGFFEGAAGVVFIPVRFLTIAAAYTSAKTVTTAATVLGYVGSGLFAVSFLLMAIPSCIAVAKNVSFTSRLDEAQSAEKNDTEEKKLQAGVLFLMKELGLSNDERREACEEVLAKETHEDVDIDPEDLARLTPFDKGFIEGYIRKKNPDLDDVTYAQMEKEAQLSFINLRKVKEVDLTRKAGPETLKLVKEEMGKEKSEMLVFKLIRGEGVEEAKALLKKVVSEARFNKWMHIAMIVFCVLGAAAFIAGNFFTGGALGITVAAIWVAVSIGFLAIDGYFLWQAYKNGSPDFKDKVLMSIGAVFLISATVLGTVFSGGILPIVVSGVVGGLWVVLGGYSYYRWSHNSTQQLAKEEIERRERERRIEEKQRLIKNESHGVNQSTA